MHARQTHDRYAALTWLILVMTLVVLVIGAIATRYVESRLVASRGESLALAASEIAHKLDLLLAERYSDVRELAQNPILRGHDVAAKTAYLDSLRATSPLYLLVGVTDAQGRFVAATDCACIGMDMSRSSWFQAARGTQHIHVGDVEPFEEAGGIDAISFTAPIEGAGGEFQGTVTTRVGLPLLEDLVARTIRTFQTSEEPGWSLEYKFVTAGGDVFIDSDLFHKGNVNLKRMGLPSALLSESDRPGYFEEEHLHRHVPVVTGYARTHGAGEFPGLKWTVLLRTSKDNLVAPIRNVLWKLAAAWVLVWAPMFGFLLWSAARLKKETARAQDEHARALTAESNYRQLVEQARDIIYRADVNGYFTYVNPTVTRIKGYAPEEVVGRHFTEFVRPDSREAVKRLLMRQFVRQTPSTYHEFPAIAKGGREIWIGQNVQVLFENGRVTGFHAVARDITERKRAEEALKASEKRFRTILEAEPECVKVTTEDGVLLDMNAAGLAMIEADSLQQVVGQSVCPLIAPAYRDAFSEFNRRVFRGKPGTMQFEIVGLKGQRRWMDTHAVPLRNEQNVAIGVLAITHDITERKREEKILQALLEGTASVTGELFFPALVRSLASALGVRHALVTELLEGERPRLRMLAIWMGDRLGSPTEYELVRTPCEKVIELGEAYYQHSVQELFPEDKDLVALGARSYLGIALTSSSDKTIGHLCILDDKPLPDEHRITPLLTIFASRAAAELERKQAEETLRERARLSSFAAEVSLALNRETSTDEMLRQCVDATVRHLGAALARVWTVEPGDLCATCHKAAWCTDRAQCLHLRASAGLSTNLDGEYRRVPLGALKIGRIAQGMGAMATNNILDDERLPNKDWIREQGLQSFAGFPLTVEGKAFGVMAMFAKVALSEATIQTLESICNGIATTIARKRMETVLQESETQMRLFMEATADCIWNWDLAAACVTRNAGFEKLFGYATEEIVPTIDWWAERLHPDDRDRVWAMYTNAIAGGRTTCSYEYRFRRRDGSYAIISDHAFIVRDGTGKVVRALGAMTDITERKRAEQGLRERSRQQAIEAELSRLAATVQDLPSLLDTAAKLTSNALEVDYCEVLELLPESSELRLRASAGWKSDRIGQVRAVETGSLAHAALQSSKPAVRTFPDATRFGGPPWLYMQGAAGGMSVNIPGKESPWGVLGVYTAGTRAFSRDDINFLQTVSSILATSIERMQTENVLKGANQALRLLSRQLLRVQEDDRRTIARDLHDEIGQSLTAIKLNVERAQRTSDRAARARIMQDCAQITERVLGQVRNLSLDLHPSILDDLGLAYALKWYAGLQAERAGLHVTVTANPSLPRLSQDIEITCFRIAQEAVTNVVRHAQARHASVTLKQGTAEVELCIQDDGIGFVVDKAASPASIGLASMQERAKLLGGTVKVTSAPHGGTKVIATLPLSPATAAETPAIEASRS